MGCETRDRVLAAAGPIFAEKGFEAATVREICSEAGVNLASVNYHFGDKESLYLETVRLAQAMRMEQVPPAEWPDDATPEQKLALFVQTMLSRMLSLPDTAWSTRLLMREMFQPTIALEAIVEDFIRPQLDQLLGIVDEFLSAQIAEHERHQIAFSIVGQCVHYRMAQNFVSLLVPAGEWSAYYSVDQLAEHITKFSLAALKELRRQSNGTEETQLSHCEKRLTEAMG